MVGKSYLLSSQRSFAAEDGPSQASQRNRNASRSRANQVRGLIKENDNFANFNALFTLIFFVTQYLTAT